MAEETRTPVFFNELHYEDMLSDQFEGFEIAAPGGTNLKGWSVSLYGGADGKVYKTVELKGLVPDLQNGFGVLFFFVKGIHDGSSNGDGMALVDKSGKVRQFLSYEGAFEATDGPAKGMTSDKIPVAEFEWSHHENSLQLQGKGSCYEDFEWKGPVDSTPGEVNGEQVFEGVPISAPEPGHVTLETFTGINRESHHTTDYVNKSMLILRRANTFQLGFKTNLEPSALTIVLTVFPETSEQVKIKVSDAKPEELSKTEWAAFVKEKSDDGFLAMVSIPANAKIGQYSLSVTNGDVTDESTHPVIVLFNPWSEDDGVYMEDDSWRTEYVLNQEGVVWQGSEWVKVPQRWLYAQFEELSVLACLKLVEMIPLENRGDPVLFSRKLSALVNVQDEGGVLVGNWSGNYADGTKPKAWVSSHPILEQFYVSGQGVKYGQCWVFAAVLCSVCRCLGIPCRPITNFNSAHDTSFDRGIEYYFYRDGDGKLVQDSSVTSDSIWNFHVWNDVWMRRPDLPSGYGGWQALDSRPQEKSEGIFQTGPCPITAIKAGEKDKSIKYDLDFIYAEVNADVKHFAKGESGEYELIKVETTKVGQSLWTKSVGSFLKTFATSQYKYKEGSAAERAVHLDENNEAFTVTFDVDHNKVAGEDFVVKMKLKRIKTEGAVDTNVKYVLKLNSRARQKKSILNNFPSFSVTFSAYAVYYTGKPRSSFKSENTNLTIPADGSEVDFSVPITVNDYLALLDDDHQMKFNVYVLSEDKKETALQSLDFDLDNPVINIELEGVSDLTINEG
eukprot:CAMPEP_0168539508 /NCGR_PEP_ID=MMETSP0405-20121227/21874_1 /TAXON_ID=498012 /ORGANISM="Trichosphaerium sp, Strain Am-I-7 wt" /LENGTH=784 /DNA_ID=CAMNT_0008569093 /DNA_START=106 /DNA_END=2459 /DNA_ORIENTATION=+